MRYFSKSALLAAMMFLVLAGVASCDDGNPVDGDSDVNCDDLPADRWEECHDGGGGDADSDGDGDVDGDVETVILTMETSIPGVLVEVTSDVRRCQQEADSFSCDVEVTLGVHEVRLSHPDGWTQRPIQIAVTPDGITILGEIPTVIAEAEGFVLRARLDFIPDFTSTTWRDEDGNIVELYGGCSAEVSPACPNSFCGFGDRGGVLPSGVCVEGDTVTLSSYEDDLWAEGTVGQNEIVITYHSSYCEPPCGDRFIFTRD